MNRPSALVTGSCGAQREAVDAARRLAERLRDQRGGRVVFLSHCLLNENTRYLGGATQAGPLPEVLDACADAGIGMVQMPCPEERAWGGVRKRRLLLLYGSDRWLPAGLRRRLLTAALAYTRWVYRRLARQAARQIADYRRNGMDVVALVGVDGSPSCGVACTLDLRTAADRLAACPRRTMTVDDANAVVRETLAPGPGMYTAMLGRELQRRRVEVHLLAHDLLAELDGKPSTAVPAILRRG